MGGGGCIVFHSGSVCICGRWRAAVSDEARAMYGVRLNVSVLWWNLIIFIPNVWFASLTIFPLLQCPLLTYVTPLLSKRIEKW